MSKLDEAEGIVRQTMSKLSYLETELQNFNAENSELFAGATELLASPSGECPLLWHQCFECYTKHYGDALDNFLREFLKHILGKFRKIIRATTLQRVP